MQFTDAEMRLLSGELGYEPEFADILLIVQNYRHMRGALTFMLADGRDDNVLSRKEVNTLPAVQDSPQVSVSEVSESLSDVKAADVAAVLSGEVSDDSGRDRIHQEEFDSRLKNTLSAFD